MPKEGQEPLLQQEDTSGSQDAEVVWEGITWQGFGSCLCLSPLTCSSWKWHVTKHRIDLVHGFAGSSIDTIDFRRVTDMHFHRSVFQMCCNRGTITFHSANDSMPVLELTTFGTQDLYHKIKDAWTQAKVGVVSDDHHHH